MSKKILIEVSARHVHLNKNDLEVLFGRGYHLQKLRNLKQPGEFAAKEMVTLKFGPKILKGVRVVGPLRKKKEIEISLTDAHNLGLASFLTKAGRLKNGVAVFLMGRRRKIKVSNKTVIALRHLHISSAEAKNLGVKNGQFISVRVSGPREILFKKVKVRFGQHYKTSVHLDTDEGNAAGIRKNAFGQIV